MKHAKWCVQQYPTIVNNIKKDNKMYQNNMSAYATLDNSLAASQTDIGESSNLAQIAQTYSCTYDDEKFKDYVCILSVLAQVAIDNCKRRFDVDLTAEIKRIKKDLDMSEHKYPQFWKIIKRGFNSKNINKELICPMNYLSDLNLTKFRDSSTTLPMSDFFIKHSLDVNRKICKKVEDLIEKYSFNLFEVNSNEDSDYEDYILLRSDYEQLIHDIRSLNLSDKYIGIISWILDRAFLISPMVYRNRKGVNSTIYKNKSLLLKVLYDMNEIAFLKCWDKK